MVTTEDISSKEHLKLALALSDVQLDVIRKNQRLGGELIAGKLEKLRDAVWTLQVPDETARNDLFQKELNEGLDDKQRGQLLEAYARMGHLYEIAGLSARENYFQELQKSGRKIPGGVDEFIAENNKNGGVDTIVGQLNQPVFEVVMTMHPTNINSLESMKAQREIGKTLQHESKAIDMDAVKAAIENYETIPILHRNHYNEESRLTVYDETKVVLNALNNIYEDLPQVYKRFDSAIENTFHNSYDPTKLNLNIKLGSWGSAGDKDGNQNVTSEKTLEAIGMHTYDIVQHYRDDLEKIQTLTPELAQWKIKLDTALDKLNGAQIQESDKVPTPEALAIAERHIVEYDKWLFNEKVPDVPGRHDLRVSGQMQDKDFRQALLEKHARTIIERGDNIPVETLHETALAMVEAKKEKDDPANSKGLLGDLAKLRRDTDNERNRQWDIAENKKKPAHPFDPKPVCTPPEFNARFDKLSKELAEVRDALDPEKFKADLLAGYKAAKDAGKTADEKNLLDLTRKARIFGFSFSKIEYRETALQYKRVVNEILPGYVAQPPAGRIALLTNLLSKKELPPNVIAAVEKIRQQGAAKGYSPADALPIAYHTIKRMELARDHGGMIKDNVLAECGQIDDNANKKSPGFTDVTKQGVANLLEAQFLQRVAATLDKDGKVKRPLMGIVPLFEEPNTMEKVADIMESAYHNPAYKQHLLDLAGGDESKKTQQVQIAHSDNTRRAGSLAARAYIHEAHKKIRALNKKEGIRTQFFEGGSLSDAYRNGVRAISASVNAFELHDFAKFTFQGGDLLNYFNHPASTTRLFTRNIVHPAGHFTQNSTGQWEMNPAAKNGDKRKNPGEPDRTPNGLMDDIAIEAMKKTLNDYKEHDFTQTAMGILLAALDYHEEKNIGTNGTRAERSTFTGGTTNMGSAATKKEDEFKLVDIEAVRTIGFSEAWQHGGVVPSWIGSQDLAKHLREEITKHQAAVKDGNKEGLAALKSATKQEIAELEKCVVTHGISPETLNLFYNKSPAFRDAQDKAAFSLARSDMPAMTAIATSRLKGLEGKTGTMRVKIKNGDGADEVKEFAYPDIIEKGMQYLKVLKETYQKTAGTTFSALTNNALGIGFAEKEKFRRYKQPENAAFGQVQDEMTQALNGLAPDIVIKNNYQGPLLFAKANMRDQLDTHMKSLIHAAGDTVTHGRYLPADDEAFGKYLHDEQQRRGNGASTAIV